MRPTSAPIAFALYLVGACLSITIAGEPIPIKWKLAEEKRYTYTFNQEMTWKGGMPDAEVGPMMVEGTFKVEASILITGAEEGAKLSVTIDSIEGTEQGEPIPDERLKPELSKTIEMTISADGALKQDKDAASENMLGLPGLLFGLPREPLQPGKTIQQDVVIPASGMPDLHGKAKYTYVGTAIINELKCVKYHVSSALEAEREHRLWGNRRATWRSEMDCVFAVEAGHLVSTSGTARMHTEAEFPGRANRGKMMVLEMNTKVQLQLKEVEKIPKKTGEE